MNRITAGSVHLYRRVRWVSSGPLEFLELLQNMGASPTIPVSLSGRPHVRGEIKGYFTEATIIPATPVGSIERYLEIRLDGDTMPSVMYDNLWAEIMSVIPRKISQM